MAEIIAIGFFLLCVITLGVSFVLAILTIGNINAEIQNEVTRRFGPGVPIRDMRRSAVTTEQMGLLFLGKWQPKLGRRLLWTGMGCILSFIAIWVFSAVNNHYLWAPALKAQFRGIH
ncbi:hypothetical protein [Roseibium litorale]|uniref:Uncharacterized protein n=1 Tax=Roseibium litorale TaxID=2803841 RepID=A0ABR9CR13_9HYPH|nr:hypothetical protein [Roseibium litorale]MBD8893223.1 hypothetical protein [Roseibium litorale]